MQRIDRHAMRSTRRLVTGLWHVMLQGPSARPSARNLLTALSAHPGSPAAAMPAFRDVERVIGARAEIATRCRHQGAPNDCAWRIASNNMRHSTCSTWVGA
jgi:hypothetical protein